MKNRLLLMTLLVALVPHVAFGDAAYLRLYGDIDAELIDGLMREVDGAVANGADTVVILISTSGGSVDAGLAGYNYLRGQSPAITVVTHAFGRVASIGVLLFCAGDERLAVPNAPFTLHSVTVAPPQKVFTERDMHGMAMDLAGRTQSIAQIIARTTGRASDDIIATMDAGREFDAKQALEWGLVTRIEPSLFPRGSRVRDISSAARHAPEPKASAGMKP